jgi:hypothetical protein
MVGERHPSDALKKVKGVIRIRKLKDRKHNSQQKKKKMKNKCPQKQYTKIEQHEPHENLIVSLSFR